MNTHYDNLQVSRKASLKVIRAAYKSLVQEWHPDRHPDNLDEAERILKIINRAYDVLSDPRARVEHDSWIDSQAEPSKNQTRQSENDFSERPTRTASAQAHEDREADQTTSSSDPLDSQYAPPWKRLAAAIIDLGITYICGIILGISLAPTLAESAVDQQQLESQLTGIGYIFGWLYFAVCESSRLEGTFGKIILGLRVCDLAGNSIGFGRATGRHWGKLISALILLIGFVMIFFTRKRQGLHDQMAGCVVLGIRVPK